MAHDDRDRNFERALVRHLRSSASSGAETNALSGAPLESCPDADILSAYHEQALSSDELSLWKEHVVACSHCQFVLAQLVATENIELNASPTQDESLISELAFSRKQRPAASSATDSRPVNSRPIDSRPVKGERRRPPSWRWVLLIPAGAIAASLVVWVSLQRPKPLQISPSSPVEVAENRATPPLSTSPKPVLAVPSERKEKDQPAAPSVGATARSVSPNRDAVANELDKQEQSAKQAPYGYATKTSPGPSLSMQRQEQQQTSRVAAGSPAGSIVDQKKRDAEITSQLAQEGRAIATKSPPPPPPSQPGFLEDGAVTITSAGAAGKVPSPAPAAAPSVAAPKEKAANADAISAMNETVEVSAEPQSPARARAMIRAAALQNPHVFWAPSGKHAWRAGPAGSLESSKDKGVTWTPQVSGVDTDLFAGSAVSAKVCWIVGSSGTILRTTDGGEHWIKLNSPVTSDLTGVRASDAFHATIWFVADQQTGVNKTFETTDGGAAWSSIPPK
ncbi:MAG: hypothetical protein WA789_07680 [Candidatus Acidiferrum sp.]